jgi:photosystem II stability/assembly factor-like uncharacterized protein
MNRYERVRQILDDSIGGPSASIGRHGPFWRNRTRDDFVAHAVFGLPLVTVGQGSASNLVKALRGENPFGKDIGTPGASIRRMPAGRPPVPAEQIAFIERWIDEGCLEDEIVPMWRATNAPLADQDGGKRYDDLWFVTADTGWAVNSDGKILRTDDGGTTWAEQFHDPSAYLRCIGFAGPERGWAGLLTGPSRMLETHDGKTWAEVPDLPADGPQMICGLSVLDGSVVYAAGTNYPFPFPFNPPPAMMKTVDGGATWSAWDMTPHASLLVDVHFTTAQTGWVVGGKADPTLPAGPDGRANVKPVVLFTDDGGSTWTNQVADLQNDLPAGEWGWKIHFVNPQLGFVSLENFDDAAVLKTTDGGAHWTRVAIDDPQRNANLEGVGFIDEQRGWVGGWGKPAFEGGQSSATEDGGASWRNANEIGKFINRFRFVDDSADLGYAAGATVYKYSAEPVPEQPKTATSLLHAATIPTMRAVSETGSTRVRIEFTVPPGSSRVAVNAWERFGKHVAQILDEREPTIGDRVVEWDTEDGVFIIRATVDDDSDSRIVHVARQASRSPGADA